MTVLTAEHQGKKARIKLIGNDKTLEGKIDTVSKSGIVLFKSKGTSIADVVRPDEIDEVTILDDTDEIIQTVLKPVKLATVRRHLVSAHGWGLKKVNGLSDEEAMDIHALIHDAPDGSADDLGHRHGDPKSKNSDNSNQDELDLEEGSAS